MDTCQVDLKGSDCPKVSLLRNDFICNDGGIFKCLNKSTLSFQNIDSKEIATIDRPSYWRLEVLQLVPIKWDVSEGRITLTGRELGLGPQHVCKVVGFNEFQQMNVINREALRGNKTDYFVQLSPTKDSTHYLLNIEIR